jgi:hypothetical protein
MHSKYSSIMNSILIRYREHTPAEAECRSVAMRYGIDRSMSAPGVLIVATLFGTSVGTVAALLIRGDEPRSWPVASLP